MHDYTVELRIQGKDLEVSEVSATLGLEPTNTRQAGQKLTRTRVYEKAMWGYEVYPPSSGGDERRHHWESLEAGLKALLALMMPLKRPIAEYQGKFEVCVWIGHFSSSFDGGPTLSPAMLKALSEFGVKLSFDTYFSQPEK